MTNPGVTRAFKKINIKIVEVDVGDKNIIKEIMNEKVDLGSEPSGHIILDYGEKTYLGDGVLVARKIIDIISRVGLEKIISWIKEISLYPIKTVNYKISKKVLKNLNVKKCLKKIIDKKEENDKIIIRPSGTEDLVRVTVSTEQIKKQVIIHKNIKNCLMGEHL